MGGFATVSAVFFPLTSVKIDVKNGEKIFVQRCQSCHSLDGSLSRGPSLVNLGSLAKTRIQNQSAEEYILQSILFPSKYLVPGSEGIMPENVSQGLTKDEILSLVGFLSTQNGNLQVKNLLELNNSFTSHSKSFSKTSIDAELAEKGRRLFIGKLNCSVCHPLDASPAHELIAPSLLKAGIYSEKHIRESIYNPNKVIDRKYKTVVINDNGIISSGRLISQDENSLLVLTQKPTGGYEPIKFEIPADGSLEVAFPGSSLMPSYEDKITEDEYTSLLMFLQSLK